MGLAISGTPANLAPNSSKKKIAKTTASARNPASTIRPLGENLRAASRPNGWAGDSSLSCSKCSYVTSTSRRERCWRPASHRPGTPRCGRHRLTYACGQLDRPMQLSSCLPLCNRCRRSRWSTSGGQTRRASADRHGLSPVDKLLPPPRSDPSTRRRQHHHP